MTIGFIAYVISTMGTLIVSFYIYKKAVNHKAMRIHTVLAIIWCLFWALLYSFEPTWIPALMMRVLYCIASIALIWVLLKTELDVVVSAFLLSYGASLTLYAIAYVPIGLLFSPFLGSEEYNYNSLVNFNDPVYLLIFSLVAALQFAIAFWFFSRRRFKRGFSFLFGRYTVVLALIIAGVVLAIFSVIVAVSRGNLGTHHISLPLIASTIIVGAGLVVWIIRSIKARSQKLIKANNEVQLAKDNERLANELAEERAVNENLREACHSLNHRLGAMERRVAGLLERKHEFSAEFSDELSVTLADIRKLSGEHFADVGRVKHTAVLPSTNVQAVDDMFNYYADQFEAAGIKFSLKVHGSVVYMTKNIITLANLETMIGDHLKNALIAVSKSDLSVRSVKAAIGEVEDCYEFTVHDSGIPFDVDTLVKLGTERVTTHAANGGSGVGFMKTFETMRESNASLIITESKGGLFSKSVTIRFDGEDAYIIDTYRPEAFPPSDRYTVVGQ